MIPGKTLAAAAGGIAAAFASALCCAGPILAVTAGLSSAGLSATFEPLRPYMLVATALFLAGGFYQLHREERACELDKPCANEHLRKAMKITLWTSTVIAIIFATYPTWQTWVIS